jgi:exodeoxyribonuclease-3
MKITTFNVNGLRAILNKGILSWIENDRSDVLCLQEIKMKPEQISEDVRNLGYPYAIWNPAEKPGYSGVATFQKEFTPDNGTGLGLSRFDGEGRVIWTKHELSGCITSIFRVGKEATTASNTSWISTKTCCIAAINCTLLGRISS